MTSEELLAKIVKEEITIRVHSWVKNDPRIVRAEIEMYPNEEWLICTYAKNDEPWGSIFGSPDTIFAQMKRLGILEE